MIDDLVTWTRAQLDDDERVALGAEPGPWTLDLRGGGLEPMACVMVPMPPQPGAKTGLTQLARVPSQPAMTAEHIVRHDPDRVLLEVEAKRRILDESVDAVEGMEERIDEEWNPGEPVRYPVRDLLLRLLALPYSDRPGYREDWRP